MKINQFNSQIFSISFTNLYKLGMFSARTLAYFEYKYKKCDIFDYMEYYAKKKKANTFSLTAKNEGYCFTSDLLDSIVEYGIPDSPSKYDYQLLEAYNHCNSISNKFTLLVHKGNGVLHHELAHAFYFLYPGYRMITNLLLQELPEDVFNNITIELKKFGYSEDQYLDEAQAFLSSNPSMIKVNYKFCEPFKKYYKKTYLEVKGATHEI